MIQRRLGQLRSRRGHGEVTERSRRGHGASPSRPGPSIELTTTHPALGLSEAPSGPVLANSTSLPSPPLSPAAAELRPQPPLSHLMTTLKLTLTMLTSSMTVTGGDWWCRDAYCHNVKGSDYRSHCNSPSVPVASLLIALFDLSTFCAIVFRSGWAFGQWARGTGHWAAMCDGVAGSVAFKCEG